MRRLEAVWCLWVAAAVGGCVPRWWEATPWQGDDVIAAGALCESRDIAASGEDFWLRLGVRWHAGVDIDWGALELELTNADIIHKSLSEPRRSGEADELRYVVWTVRAAPGDGTGGDQVSLGPITVPWRASRDSAFKDLEVEGCTATMR